MDITCTACTEGTGSAGNPCVVCGGDGLIVLGDEDFPKLTGRWGIHGVIWKALFTQLGDLEAKVDAVIAALPDVCKHPGGGP